MSSLITWTFTIDDLTANANMVKDLLAQRLNLPELDKVVIIVQRPSVVGRFKKWLRIDADIDKNDTVCYNILTTLPKKED